MKSFVSTQNPRVFAYGYYQHGSCGPEALP